MKIRINITKEVLQASRFCGLDPSTERPLSNDAANVGRNCGIAIAVCDLIDTAWVSHNYIWIYDTVPTYIVADATLALLHIKLPFEATDFIDAFDHLSPDERAEMRPFSFEIDIPEALINHIGITEVDRILAESKTLERA